MRRRKGCHVQGTTGAASLLWSVTLSLVGSSLAPQPSGHVEHKASLVSAADRAPKGGPVLKAIGGQAPHIFLPYVARRELN